LIWRGETKSSGAAAPLTRTCTFPSVVGSGIEGALAVVPARFVPHIEARAQRDSAPWSLAAFTIPPAEITG
jgi:hypothetical protein